MSQPNMVLLYVTEPARSVKFYQSVLGSDPIEQSPRFAMFKMNDATMLGLWIKDDVKPEPKAAAGAAELGLHVGNEAELNAKLAAWKSAGTTIAQEPQRMDFGLTFTALDPDGHRLRVFCD